MHLENMGYCSEYRYGILWYFQFDFKLTRPNSGQFFKRAFDLLTFNSSNDAVYIGARLASKVPGKDIWKVEYDGIPIIITRGGLTVQEATPTSPRPQNTPCVP